MTVGKRRVRMWTKGKTLIVGVKLATASREVLTWTLVKVARPGDHVIALHVVTSSSDSEGSSKERNKTDQHIASTFDAVVGVYEGFCNLKQVTLEVKISHSPFLRKALLEEVKLYEGSKLILGTSKRDALVYETAKTIVCRIQCLESPISLAKYCAKRLPSTTSVLVVDHGKVVFEKDGAQSTAGTVDAKVRVFNASQWKLKSLDCKVSNNAVQEPLAITESSSDTANYDGSYVSSKHDGITDMDSDYCRLTRSPASILNDHKHNLAEMNTLRSCITPKPICALFTSIDGKESPLESETGDSGRLSSSDSFHTVSSMPDQIPLGEEEGESSALSVQIKDKRATPEPISGLDSPPGWPLLHRAISIDKKSNPQSKARKMSVVEWALQLPDRRGQVIGQLPMKAEVTQGSFNKENESGASTEGILRETPRSDQIEAREEKHSLVKRVKFLCGNKPCKQFKYEVLQSATSNFSAENLVGKGGCSRVYRGVLYHGQSVAVKCLNPSPETEQDLLLEVEIITTLQHEHIVSLIGYCVEKQNCFLVYNFVSRGDLEENLHGGKDKQAVPWKERLKVAVGVADALDYLHDGCPRPVIHRDVKSSNILLSEDFEPQLSDFGLAKWASTTSSYITCSDVVGTFGYLAPEYFMYGKVNEKTDVYSFGVVLLELITGRQPINTRNPKCQESLVMWARPLLEDGSMSELIDPNLEDAYDAHEMQRMMLAAALCVRQSPQFRPRMTRILKLLRGEGDDLTYWATHQLTMSKDKYADDEDEESYGRCDVRTHLTLAMLGVDDDVVSFSSTDHSGDLLHANKSLEDFLGGRYSHSSSFE